MAEEGDGGLSDGVVVMSKLGSGCQSKRRGGLCTGLPLMSYDGLRYGIDTGMRKGNGPGRWGVPELRVRIGIIRSYGGNY